MFRNFLILAYRNFKRSPLTSFIELFGMTAGLTVFILILLWVVNEVGYDRFNKDAELIYRLELNNNNDVNSALIPSIVAPLLKDNLPEIEEIVRFRRFKPNIGFVIDNYGNKVAFDTGSILLTDNSFFRVFSFEFITGNPEMALTKKETVVITETLAKTIFGNKNPIGELISERWTITGVIKDIPNFHIPFKMLRSFVSLEQSYLDAGFEGSNIWRLEEHPTYLRLNRNQDIVQLENKITSFLEEHRPEEFKKLQPNLTYHLRPLKELYFEGNKAKEGEYAIHGDHKKLMAYISIAVFILLLACINFINLNSAKSLERAREVAIKKVVGATRFSIFLQFLGEVIILCNIALIFSLLILIAIIPRFNNLLNVNLSLNQLLNPLTFVMMIFGLLLISLVSGGIPALYMSSFHPVQVMKGMPSGNINGYSFKKANLVIQFAVTMILLIGSITIFRQIQYMKNTDLGFNKEHTIAFNFSEVKFGVKARVLKSALLSNPNILHVSHTFATPGITDISDRQLDKIIYKDVAYELAPAYVDADYQKTLELEMVKGRFFENDRMGDHLNSWKDLNSSMVGKIVLNQLAVKKIGLKDPIGAILKFQGGGTLEVIGVIKDFHMASLENSILPTYFLSVDIRFRMMANISSKDLPTSIEFIDLEFEKLTGKKPNIKFLDEEFNKQYGNEEAFSELIGYFTILAILIACMGLFGVAVHTIKLRLKEIGIRKTLGASSWIVLKLLILYFLKILGISMIIAVPIAWLAMDSWLRNYPYRIELTSWVFIVGSVITIIIAMLTIIWKSWQASNLNPVKLIKYE